MDLQTKHLMFELEVQEYGVALCTNNPDGAVTFMLMIAEAIANGFFVYDLAAPNTSSIDSWSI